MFCFFDVVQRSPKSCGLKKFSSWIWVTVHRKLRGVPASGFLSCSDTCFKCSFIEILRFSFADYYTFYCRSLYESPPFHSCLPLNALWWHQRVLLTMGLLTFFPPFLSRLCAVFDSNLVTLILHLEHVLALKRRYFLK